MPRHRDILKRLYNAKLYRICAKQRIQYSQNKMLQMNSLVFTIIKIAFYKRNVLLYCLNSEHRENIQLCLGRSIQAHNLGIFPKVYKHGFRLCVTEEIEERKGIFPHEDLKKVFMYPNELFDIKYNFRNIQIGFSVCTGNQLTRTNSLRALFDSKHTWFDATNNNSS